MHVPSLHAPGALRRRPRAARRAETTAPSGASARLAREVTALVALATGLLLALWTLTALGFGSAHWWPVVVVSAFAVVAAVAAWIVARDD